MRWARGMQFWLVALFFPVFALAGAPKIHVELRDLQQLRLEFDEPMSTWSNAVDASLVQIEGSGDARCSWDSDTRLSCRLSQALAPATAYRLQLSSELKTQAGRALPSQAISFETPRPEVTLSSWAWSAGTGPIEIESNQPISLQSLRSVLRMALDGKPLHAAQLSRLPPAWPKDNRVRYGIDPGAIDGKDRVLSVRITPGLRARSGPLPGRQRQPLGRFLLNPRFAVRGLQCGSYDAQRSIPVKRGTLKALCLPGEPIRLMFSSKLDPASLHRVSEQISEAFRTAELPPPVGDLSAWETVDPFVADGIASPRGSWVELPPLPAHADLSIRLDADVLASNGDALLPVDIRLQTADAQPQLHARHGHALIADGKSPPAQVEAINTGPIELRVDGLAAEQASERITLAAERRGSVALAAHSTVAADTLSTGGWVRWTPLSRQAGAAESSVEFAAPAFDLTAMAGRREVLVWANAWDGDAPVAGAQVELLWRKDEDAPMQVAAQGRTGADGIVVLHLPEDLRVEAPLDLDAREDWQGPLWLVRALRDEPNSAVHSVLPLGRSSSSVTLGQTPPRLTWGVSDRPLYRAGEQVRYRLWQRDRIGTRLHAPTNPGQVRLRLNDEDQQSPILEWRAGFTASGDLTGALELPVHLTDGTYCIGVQDERDNTNGACFFVGSHRAQDLWAEITTPGGVLRDGERLLAHLAAGYFSGAVASGTEVSSLGASVWPQSLSEAYPKFEAFEFIDVYGDEVSSPDIALPESALRLDMDGRLKIDQPLVFEGALPELDRRPAFGLLAFQAEVSPQGREGTFTYDDQTRYARFDRYVGLRTIPSWFDAGDPIEIEGVVITAMGESLNATIDVEIDFLSGYSDPVPGNPVEGERVGQCTIATGVRTRCEFPRTRTGRYRLSARSGDAAPAQLMRYVWIEAGTIVDGVEPELSVEDASPQREGPVRLLLTQPYARARALFVIHSGDALLGYHVEALTGPVHAIELPVRPEWRTRLGIQAHVRDATDSRVVEGLRQPTAVTELDAWISEAEAKAADEPVSARFSTVSAKPGTTAQLVISNPSNHQRDVVVAVMDDALRVQAQRWLPYSDPLGPTWLGGPVAYGVGSLQRADFSEWNDAEWRWLLPWTKDQQKLPSQLKPQPAYRSAPEPVAMASSDDSGTLDRIEVTGSRIRRADVVESSEAKAPDSALRLQAASTSRSSETAEGPIALRTEFADTAYWLPDLRLAPGESRTIDVALPDNLTRWRAVVWSADEADGFAMTEAALEVGLPVEARLQAPTRLYPGDTALLATSVHHTDAAEAIAETRLRAHGAGLQIDDVQALPLQAKAEASARTEIQPRVEGLLRIATTASTAKGQDGVAADIDVVSPWIRSRRIQAGWLGTTDLSLSLPQTPPNAQQVELDLALLRGGAGISSQWTDDLRRYPHRCWEQILSRAVGAALALQRHDPSWTDAAAVVDEALRNAAVFQNHDGGFRYFASVDGDWVSPQSAIPLTAYSVQALELLQSLGQDVPERLLTGAEDFLAAVKPEATGGTPAALGDALSLFAFAAAAQTPDHSHGLDSLWRHWNQLPLPAQVAATTALAKAKHRKARTALRRILRQAPEHAGRRRLQLPQRFDEWMSSDLQLQCALIALLQAHPDWAAPRTVAELLAGISDLYAGGVASVDTQTAAICLMALQSAQGQMQGRGEARFRLGERAKSLVLVEGEERTNWNAGAPDSATLEIDPDGGASTQKQATAMSFIAELHYLEDAGQAQPSAVGFSIERTYALFRDENWMPLGKTIAQEGDWIRISLTLRNSAERRFVALTDAVPGGLLQTELALSGVASATLKQASDEGSVHFATRKLDPRNPRFYAESLPPGSHVVHYFARVGSAGNYLAAPATAELMYGSASYARTAAQRLTFEPRR